MDSGFDIRAPGPIEPRDPADNSFTDTDFDALLASAGVSPEDQRLTVAVSGGSDSLALAILLARWCGRNRVSLSALTVDHGLRPDSVGEARRVGEWMAAYGIDHHVLRWQGDKPASGVQEAARYARYDMMSRWCRDNGVHKLCLAHQAEDQAETFLMRAARGSGIDGLACMRPVSRRAGICLIRPLLGVSRSQLRGVLTAADQDWINDPSNSNEIYLRTRLGRLVTGLQNSGLPVQRIVALAAGFGELRDGFDAIIDEILRMGVTLHCEGYATVNARLLVQMHEEVGRRLLIHLVRLIGGKPYAPRRDRVDRAVDRLRSNITPKSMTLGGCRIMHQGHEIMISREVRRDESQMAVLPGDNVHWRGLFACSISADSPANSAPVYVRSLGPEGWREVVKECPELRNSAIPYPVRLALPALADEREIVAVPHLNFRRKRRQADVNGPSAHFDAAIFLQLNAR